MAHKTAKGYLSWPWLGQNQKKKKKKGEEGNSLELLYTQTSPLSLKIGGRIPTNKGALKVSSQKF